ncbi:MAG: GNAT family N-acetyltransferase [Gammaproteobacteria bacterium]
MSEPPAIRVLSGRDDVLGDYVDDLARLRITVFRDFPYLYAGSLDYERNYLATYLACPDSVVVLALDGDDVVGASTGLPLDAETAEFQRPFRAAGIDPASVFYGGESVLLPAWRGRGIYRAFFAGRENHARALGRFERMVFCAVVRAPDHPRRPPAYVPLDPVWARFGYSRRDDLVTTFEWQDLDENAPSPKQMVFWEKAL